MLFRALSNKDMLDLESIGNIIAKKPCLKGTIKDVLMEVNSHIRAGSLNDYCWISLSSSFDIVVENYSMPSIYNDKRGYIAVIMNHDKNSLTDKKYHTNIFDFSCAKILNIRDALIKVNINDIENITLNLSSKDERKKLQNREMLLKADGKIAYDFFLGYNYSAKSKEFLVCNKIMDKDIMVILDPLRIDILYAIKKEKGLTEEEISHLIMKFLEQDQGYVYLTEIERILVNAHYINNESLTSIVETIKIQNPNADVLAVYNYIKNIKRRVIEKFVALYYEKSLKNIAIPEDTIDMIRVGETHSKNNWIMYNGHTLIVPECSKGLMGNYSDATRIALISNDFDLKIDDDAYWLNLDGTIAKRRYVESSSDKSIGRVLTKNQVKILRR